MKKSSDLIYKRPFEKNLQQIYFLLNQKLIHYELEEEIQILELNEIKTQSHFKIEQKIKLFKSQLNFSDKLRF